MRLLLEKSDPEILSYGSYYVESASSFGATDEDKDRIYLFQLQQTLTETLNAMPDIRESIVIVEPRPSDKGTAAVSVELEQGITRLTDEDASAIKDLVANTFDWLEAENITLVDNKMHVY